MVILCGRFIGLGRFKIENDAVEIFEKISLCLILLLGAVRLIRPAFSHRDQDQRERQS